MKTSLIKIATIIAFLALPLCFGNNGLKANNYLLEDNYLSTGTVIQVSLGIMGFNYALVLDEQTGTVYVADPNGLVLRTGDTVEYNSVQKTTKGTTKGTIQIRDVVRK